MKRNYILLITVIIFTFNMVGCTKKIDINQEHDKIMDVAETLIINDFNGHKLDYTGELIEDSIKVHTITEINDEVYMLYSYNYKITESEDKFVNDEFYMIKLNVIHKDSTKYGYKIMGGGGGGGDIQSTPITAHGTGNKLYGLVQDDKVSKLLIEYQDGKVISYDTKGKEYYLVVRDDTEKLIHSNITILDKCGKIIFEFE